MAGQTFLDIRQSETRALQDQLNTTAIMGMDSTLASINNELTMPGRLIAQSTPSLVVTVGSGTIVNPNTSKNRVLPFVDNTSINFPGGTITFPSTSGNITTSPGSTYAITIGASQFVAVLVQLNSSADINLLVSAPASSLGSVVIPGATANNLALGYIIVESNASSVIQNVTNTMIYQFSSLSNANSSATLTVPVSTNLTSTGTPVGYAFLCSPANATVGATYTSNGHTYTVAYTISAGSILFATNTSAPFNSGTLTLASGTGDSTITYSQTQPYALFTTPVGALYLKVKVQGAGGGGGASDAGPSTDDGFVGFFSVFGTLYATGGGGGAANGNGGGSGVPGVGVGGTYNYNGNYGQSLTSGLTTGNFYGPNGGSSPQSGGNGQGGVNGGGNGGDGHFGSGGGGAGGSSNYTPGGPGSSGGLAKVIISSPAASYPYAVGSGGFGGVSTANHGGNGGSGFISIEACYQ